VPAAVQNLCHLSERVEVGLARFAIRLTVSGTGAIPSGTVCRSSRRKDT